MRREGPTLGQIRETLESCSSRAPIPMATRWRHFAAAPDVQVLINEDVPPWRMHALQKALDQFIKLANAETYQKGEP